MLREPTGAQGATFLLLLGIVLGGAALFGLAIVLTVDVGRPEPAYWVLTGLGVLSLGVGVAAKARERRLRRRRERPTPADQPGIPHSTHAAQ